MRLRHSLCCYICVTALFAQAPAGNRAAHRADQGESIIPGGRLITPIGEQFRTGSGPFGLEVSPHGRFVVTADGGPDRFGFTILDTESSKVKSIVAPRKDDPDGGDDWRGSFLGLAFEDEKMLYAAEGESGAVRIFDPETGHKIGSLSLNQNGYKHSYSTDIALDSTRHLLYVVDQANFRLAVFDTRQRRLLSSVRVGRLPFAIALSADGREAYVSNMGIFEYSAIPGADTKRGKETGLPFPPFGIPSKDSRKGVRRQTEQGAVQVPGLGDPNVQESNSLAIIDCSDPSKLSVSAFVRTGIPLGAKSEGGSGPSGVLLHQGKAYVTNGNQDSVSVINPKSRKVESEIPLRIAGYETLRGILPIGLEVLPSRNWLLVAEAGINAIGVIDLKQNRLIAHIPVGWFPARIKARENTVYVCNVKGTGTGPNVNLPKGKPGSLEGVMHRGTLTRFALPAESELAALTQKVMANNGFTSSPAETLPAAITYAVIIVKENRTFDEVFGDLRGRPDLARFNRRVTPNHHALADQWTMSENFYSDSEVSVDGHHWLVGAYPNVWVQTSFMAAYGGQKSFQLPTTAPGRLLYAGSDSSVHPEDELQAGAIWRHFARHHVSFFNFGEGFELAGLDEGPGLAPTGARFFTNIPMPQPLFENTSRRYPGYNTNIPDQYRAAQFIGEMQERYGSGKQPLPKLLFIHLPNDHIADPRPADGYPERASFVSDNDLALGRIMEYLSHSQWWPKMAVFITEDDAQGGVDHVDSHRTLLLVASPYAKKNYVSTVHSSFPGLLKTVFQILRIPSLNLFDASASSLSDCFTGQPDLTPFKALAEDPKIFDPAKARNATDGKRPPVMDGPRVLP